MLISALVVHFTKLDNNGAGRKCFLGIVFLVLCFTCFHFHSVEQLKVVALPSSLLWLSQWT